MVNGNSEVEGIGGSVPLSDKDQFIQALEELGGYASNPALRAQLGWADQSERYWNVHANLIENDRVERGRGQGGSVRIVDQIEDVDIEADLPAEVIVYEREEDLYPHVKSVLTNHWARDHTIPDPQVVITAKQGRRTTGGAWTRPDLVLVTVRTYAYVPGKYIDVIAFEVKRQDQIDVRAVYEALAHRRAATHAYVWYHIPHEDYVNDKMFDRILDEARSLGVGVIVATDPQDYDTWDTKVPATRAELDPGILDDFISRQLEEIQHRLTRLLR